MRYLRALRPVAGMDLHCPHRWEEWNDHVFIVKTGTEADRRIERFGQALSELSRGLDGARDIPYDPAYDIEGGRRLEPAVSHLLFVYDSGKRADGFFDRDPLLRSCRRAVYDQFPSASARTHGAGVIDLYLGE
ncbi:hypothetical protein OMP38_18985 [Cohnella ginsengisoli]|uniref:Uncharacterized protein n=1 Tax=Cohnella ginsengisoli TaxID=425004 RepID=A0A9X4KJS1_9BACL|nr:hypothetical protein [Cohnella ginsengisoli]MDG0792729.1 hypothetical protein [Cohnella ginsengisoli]